MIICRSVKKPHSPQLKKKNSPPPSGIASDDSEIVNDDDDDNDLRSENEEPVIRDDVVDSPSADEQLITRRDVSDAIESIINKIIEDEFEQQNELVNENIPYL